MGQWVVFACPFCKAKLRINAAYAYLRGRCPECGVRIEPLRNKPPEDPAASASTSDEPLGLVPIDDEWPEPAQVLGEDADPTYKLATGPAPAIDPPKAIPVSPEEAYALAHGEGEREPPMAEVVPPMPYDVMEPHAAAMPRDFSHLSEGQQEELQRSLPPPPPAHPLWQGIYTFPWRAHNLGIWIFLSIDFGILAGLTAVMILLEKYGGLARIGMPLVVPVFGLIGFWIGTFAAPAYLAVVEETSAGNEEVTWPDGAGIVDGLWKFGYLIWIFGWSILPVGLLWFFRPDLQTWGIGGWVLSVLLWVLLFPIVLLSSLAGNSAWSLLDGRVLLRLIRRPHALALALVPSLALITLCLWLGTLLIIEPSFMVALGIGPIAAAAFLIHARLLGRAGWILTYDRSKKTGANQEQPAISEVEQEYLESRAAQESEDVPEGWG
jgi:hypothetical protein